MTPAEIVKFIERHRWPLSSEKDLQEIFHAALLAAGVPARREVRLDDKNIIDVMIGPVGVEMKIRGERRAIYHQCERYCMFEKVESLVLATSRSMGIPQFINCKPVMVASLSRGWL